MHGHHLRRFVTARRRQLDDGVVGRRAQRVLLVLDDQFEGETVPRQRCGRGCPLLCDAIGREALSNRITRRHRQR